MTAAHIPLLPKLIGWPLVLLGAATTVGGAWLATLGGSPFYLASGAVMVAVGWLLARGRPAALWAAALLVGGTLVWALWEVLVAVDPLVPEEPLHPRPDRSGRRHRLREYGAGRAARRHFGRARTLAAGHAGEAGAAGRRPTPSRCSASLSRARLSRPWCEGRGRGGSGVMT